MCLVNLVITSGNHLLQISLPLGENSPLPCTFIISWNVVSFWVHYPPKTLIVSKELSSQFWHLKVKMTANCWLWPLPPPPPPPNLTPQPPNNIKLVVDHLGPQSTAHHQKVSVIVRFSIVMATKSDICTYSKTLGSHSWPGFSTNTFLKNPTTGFQRDTLTKIKVDSF